MPGVFSMYFLSDFKPYYTNFSSLATKASIFEIILANLRSLALYASSDSSGNSRFFLVS